jgi:hypothetical protein
LKNNVIAFKPKVKLSNLENIDPFYLLGYSQGLLYKYGMNDAASELQGIALQAYADKLSLDDVIHLMKPIIDIEL